MKRIKIFSVCLIILSTNCNLLLSQWTKLNSGTSVRLMSVYFVSDSTGFAVGCCDSIESAILKTTNGGSTWTATYTSVNGSFLKAVYFPSPLVGYVVGTRHTVLKTTDAGISWNLSDSTIPLGIDFVSVFFLNNDTGYIGTINSGSENSLFKTTNGGVSWINISVPYLFYGANSIYFTNYNVGCLVYNDFFKTVDGGINWSVKPLPEMDYLSVQFLNDTLGFAAGIGASFPINYGTIIKTTDGGNTWNNQVFLSINSLWSLFFPSFNIGYATGTSAVTGSGTILKTIDGGTTWVTQLDTGLTPYLFSIHCLNDSLCYAVGDSGLILKTTNGGGPLGTREMQYIPLFFSVFPNPFSSFLTIEFETPSNANSQFAIFDFTGKEIISIEKNHLLNGKHQEQFNTKNLPPGLYFLIANINGQIQTMKIIKL